MNLTSDFFAPPTDVLDAMSEVLDLQRRLTDAGAELRVLVRKLQMSAVGQEQAALRAEFDEVGVLVLAYTEQLRSALIRCRTGGL